MRDTVTSTHVSPEMLELHGVDVDAGLEGPQVGVLLLMLVRLHYHVSLTPARLKVTGQNTRTESLHKEIPRIEI